MKNPEIRKRLAPFLALLDARFAPLLVVALPQAWVVYQWLDNQKYEFFSNAFAIIGAIGFEAVYIGVIAWAEGRANRNWVKVTSIAALVFSALIAVRVYWVNWDKTLGDWGGLLSALLHAGFPLLAYCYTMTIHSALNNDVKQPEPVSQPQPDINEMAREIAHGMEYRIKQEGETWGQKLTDLTNLIYSEIALMKANQLPTPEPERVITQPIDKISEKVEDANNSQLLRILELKNQGKSNREIASALGISEGTVRNRLSKAGESHA